jgi:hypothetical protein
MDPAGLRPGDRRDSVWRSNGREAVLHREVASAAPLTISAKQI